MSEQANMNTEADMVMPAAPDAFGAVSWSCENLNAHGADGMFQRDCALKESNHAAHLAVR